MTTENQLKLDVRALQGQVVAHLETSKGWNFWIPLKNRIVNSALVPFVDTKHNHFAYLGKLGDDDFFYHQDLKVHIDPSFRMASQKIDVNFVMNLMQMGEFSHGIEFPNQELIIDKITQLYRFYTILFPSHEVTVERCLV
jgi:hypothetical protein